MPPFAEWPQEPGTASGTICPPSRSEVWPRPRPLLPCVPEACSPAAPGPVSSVCTLSVPLVVPCSLHSMQLSPAAGLDGDGNVCLSIRKGCKGAGLGFSLPVIINLWAGVTVAFTALSSGVAPGRVLCPLQGKLAILSLTTGGTADMYWKTGASGDFRYFLWPLQVRHTPPCPAAPLVQMRCDTGLKARPL